MPRCHPFGSPVGDLPLFSALRWMGDSPGCTPMPKPPSQTVPPPACKRCDVAFDCPRRFLPARFSCLLLVATRRIRSPNAPQELTDGLMPDATSMTSQSDAIPAGMSHAHVTCHVLAEKP